MLDHILQRFSKSQRNLSDDAQDFVTNLAASEIWVLAIGVRGSPPMLGMTDPASFSTALAALATTRRELSELGDDDSVFPFNYKQDGRQILPFFSSEERAGHYLQDSGFGVDLSVFQPYGLLAGFVAAPFNEKFDLILDPRSSSERRIDDEERLLLRSLSSRRL